MRTWWKRLCKRREQPTVWTFRCPLTGLWSKVVAYEAPPIKVGLEWMRIGPFRSEIDAEEFCDRNNRALVLHVASTYEITGTTG